MPLDPQECRENAERCLKLASETADCSAQQILVSTAQNWERLASTLAETQEEFLAPCLR